MKGELEKSGHENTVVNLEYMLVDLGSLRSTLNFINEFINSGQRLHLLVCNAGIAFVAKGRHNS